MGNNTIKFNCVVDNEDTVEFEAVGDLIVEVINFDEDNKEINACAFISAKKALELLDFLKKHEEYFISRGNL